MFQTSNTNIQGYNHRCEQANNIVAKLTNKRRARRAEVGRRGKKILQIDIARQKRCYDAPCRAEEQNKENESSTPVPLGELAVVILVRPPLVGRHR